MESSALSFEAELDNNKVHSYEQLVDLLKVNPITTLSFWHHIQVPGCVTFLNIVSTSVPTPEYSVTDLKVSVHFQQARLSTLDENYTVPDQITDLRKLASLLERIEQFDASLSASSKEYKLEKSVSIILALLEDLREGQGLSQEQSDVLAFLTEQLSEQPLKAVPRYSADLLVFSSIYAQYRLMHTRFCTTPEGSSSHISQPSGGCATSTTSMHCFSKSQEVCSHVSVTWLHKCKIKKKL